MVNNLSETDLVTCIEAVKAEAWSAWHGAFVKLCVGPPANPWSDLIAAASLAASLQRLRAMRENMISMERGYER